MTVPKQTLRVYEGCCVAHRRDDEIKLAALWSKTSGMRFRILLRRWRRWGSIMRGSVQETSNQAQVRYIFPLMAGLELGIK
jgi:hypothetical protein